MKQLIQKALGKNNYLKLEYFKKRFFPTKYDREQEKFLTDQMEFYSNIVKPYDLCFDIGGNIGLKTDVFLRLKAKVVTLEPQRNCIEILKAKFGSRAIILQKGAGAENDIKTFYVSNNSPLSSFSKDWVNEFNNTRFVGSVLQSVEKIEVVTLDSLIDEYGKPGFIKIDVEGYEIEVLKGLSKPFGCLSFEYAVPEKNEDVVTILEHLRNKYSDLICNYAICNDSTFALEKWQSIDSMLLYVQQEHFNSTFAGDIYVKTN